MGKGLNKEQIVFFVGAALFVWVMVKLGLNLGSAAQPGSPKAPVADIRRGEPDIGTFIASAPLASYLGRGARDPFGRDARQPARFFVRAAVSHAFLSSKVFTRCAFDCRMIPSPVAEVRFRLPPRVRATHVFSQELDRAREWGQDDRTLVVPVKPTPLKRGYFRCQVTVVVRSAITPPTQWAAPVITCTGATPNVVSESGHIAVSVPGEHVLVTPVAERGGLTGLDIVRLEDLPKALIAQSNTLAYHYAEPDHELTLNVQSRVVARAPSTPGGQTPEPAVRTPAPVVRTPGPVVRTPEPGVRTTEPQAPKLAIPPAADADALPFKLAAIVRIEAPEPRRQAVLRHKESGEYMRKFEGDVVLDNLRIASITDDAVIIEDAEGKRYKFRGRFEDKYNE